MKQDSRFVVKIDLQFFDDRPPLAVYTGADIDAPPPDMARARPANAIERADEGARLCGDPLPQVSYDGATRQTHALLRRLEDALCDGQGHAP